jgi:hypothetical protein
MFSFTFYHRITNNSVNRTNLVNDDGTMIFYSENFKQSLASGSEINYNLSVGKKANIMFGLDGFYYSLNGEMSEEDVKLSSFNYNLNVSPSFKIKNSVRVQMTLFYSSPSVAPLGKTASNYIAGISVRKDFKNQKGSVSLAIRDALKTGTFTTEAHTSEYDSKLNWINDAPVIILSLSYKINNYQKSQIKYEGNEINL